MKSEILLNINGQKMKVEVGAYDLLSTVLRDKLGLTGTKRGCDYGGCGACTVIMDGKVIYSCMTPVRYAVGKSITTIEGLAKNGRLDPVQEAFVKHTAFQCGYCTPGIIMASKALLDKNPNPTEQDMMEALSGNLCRCTGYAKIFEAIHDAARSAREANSSP